MENQEKKIKKGGRPTLGKEKLAKVLPCRLTVSEYEKVVKDAEQTKLKPSELGRQYIVKGFVSNLFSDAEQTEKRQLIGMRNNLNQLVKLAHLIGFRSHVLQIDSMLKQIDEILNRYNHVSKSKPRR